MRSESRSGFSRIIVRFRDLNEDDFDDHVTDLRREIQNRAGQLPDAAEASEFLQVNSDNSTPAVLMLVVGQTFDENLRREADRVADDLERFSSVDRVDRMGMREPELQVLFDASRMQGIGVSPAVLSDTVRAYFRDRAIGSLALGNQKWLVRLSGTRNDPSYLENLPLLATEGEVPIRSVARLRQRFSEPTELIEYANKPAVLLPIYKNENASLLGMVDRVKGYAADRNNDASRRGVNIVLLGDQTDVTRRALSVMENNAMVGLALVLLVIWALLGLRIASRGAGAAPGYSCPIAGRHSS